MHENDNRRLGFILAYLDGPAFISSGGLIIFSQQFNN